MGQYLQMGICNRIFVKKDRINKLNTTLEKVIEALNKEMDMSLYDQSETEDEFVFSLKDKIISEQLLDFLRFQYSLYTQEEPYTNCFNTVLKMISEHNSFEQIEEILSKKSFPCFQSSNVFDQIKVNVQDWIYDWIYIEYSLWLLFLEGKIFLESYNDFFRYLENQVREASKKWSIAGAFRCFIE
ncbi:hypothetical protein J9303_16895 [Bacillaceae bacterium Marseille-Q3522]|nr:hypothetical protein [Bacillaceae bacterium Marseille-Q3522]